MTLSTPLRCTHSDVQSARRSVTPLLLRVLAVLLLAACCCLASLGLSPLLLQSVSASGWCDGFSVSVSVDMAWSACGRVRSVTLASEAQANGIHFYNCAPAARDHPGQISVFAEGDGMLAGRESYLGGAAVYVTADSAYVSSLLYYSESPSTVRFGFSYKPTCEGGPFPPNDRCSRCGFDVDIILHAEQFSLGFASAPQIVSVSAASTNSSASTPSAVTQSPPSSVVASVSASCSLVSFDLSVFLAAAADSAAAWESANGTFTAELEVARNVSSSDGGSSGSISSALDFQPLATRMQVNGFATITAELMQSISSGINSDASLESVQFRVRLSNPLTLKTSEWSTPSSAAQLQWYTPPPPPPPHSWCDGLTLRVHVEVSRSSCGVRDATLLAADAKANGVHFYDCAPAPPGASSPVYASLSQTLAAGEAAVPWPAAQQAYLGGTLSQYPFVNSDFYFNQPPLRTQTVIGFGLSTRPNCAGGPFAPDDVCTACAVDVDITLHAESAPGDSGGDAASSSTAAADGSGVDSADSGASSSASADPSSSGTQSDPSSSSTPPPQTTPPPPPPRPLTYCELLGIRLTVSFPWTTCGGPFELPVTTARETGLHVYGCAPAPANSTQVGQLTVNMQHTWSPNFLLLHLDDVGLSYPSEVISVDALHYTQSPRATLLDMDNWPHNDACDIPDRQHTDPHPCLYCHEKAMIYFHAEPYSPALAAAPLVLGTLADPHYPSPDFPSCAATAGVYLSVAAGSESIPAFRSADGSFAVEVQQAARNVSSSGAESDLSFQTVANISGVWLTGPSWVGPVELPALQVDTLLTPPDESLHFRVRFFNLLTLQSSNWTAASVTVQWCKPPPPPPATTPPPADSNSTGAPFSSGSSVDVDSTSALSSSSTASAGDNAASDSSSSGSDAAAGGSSGATLAPATVHSEDESSASSPQLQLSWLTLIVAAGATFAATSGSQLHS